jgi:hypothetical protein
MQAYDDTCDDAVLCELAEDALLVPVPPSRS